MTTATDLPPMSRSQSRWIVAQAWGFGLVIYAAAIAVSTPATAIWINDGAWTLVSFTACFICARTARRIDAPGRRAWWLIALGCGSWFIGQLHWNFNQLVLGVSMPYPNIGQLFYSAFAVFIIAGILYMPEVRHGTLLTLKHIGNVGLVVCCFVASIVLGLLEPALQSATSTAFVLVGAMHSLLLAGTFLVALFALWTYRWARSWSAMLLIVMATGIYSVSNLFYSHSMLTDTYVVSDLINASWCAVFGAIAWAAHERAWLYRNPGVEAPERMLARERWLEAIIPALLIAIMVGVALATAPHPSPRVLGMAAVVLILFAVILGTREAWIQSESQRLNDELARANQRLALANAELQTSEARYRDLNTQLEQRVTQRNQELGRAYGELEGFAYAVAHDLKSPLRSINSFAQLLREHLGEDSTPQIASQLARIRNGALRMATLIDDLLAYSHIERRNLNVSAVSIAETIATILAESRDDIQRRGVEVELDVEALMVNVDADGLKLALRNLIDNALKYSREVTAPQLEIKAKRTGDVVLIEIADNGIGFDMAHHEQIFKIFQRLHREEQYPGTGIGLALVRKAAQRLQGRVWASSEVGKGARFFLELPLAPGDR
jgi:signal transduction histidine kinase